MYPNGKPLGLLDVMLGLREGCTVMVHYRIFNVEEIPKAKDKTQLRNWIYRVYQEKEELLEEFYTTGRQIRLSNRNTSSNRNVIQHVKWKYFLFNAFYVISFLFLYSLLRLVFIRFC